MEHEKFELNIIYSKICSQGFAGMYNLMEAITTARTCLRLLLRMQLRRQVRAAVLATKKNQLNLQNPAKNGT